MSIKASTLPNQRHGTLYIDLLDSQASYTCGDRIKGLVRIEPATRPVQISIVFQGFSTIHDSNAKGVRPEFFEYSRILFESSGPSESYDILRRGTADDGKVELPFEFTFPQKVRLPPPSDRTWWYSQDIYNHPRFQHSQGYILPPSCELADGPTAPKITYRLEAHMAATAAHSAHVKVRHDLRFVPPAPNYHPALLQPDLNFGLTLPKHCCRYKFIRTRKLLPRYNESSKLGKIKDVLVDKELFFGLASFSEVPFARFNLFATPARVLIIGARVPVIVTVQHLERSDSLPSPPDLFIRRVRVQLVSITSTFVPTTARESVKENVEVNKETITLYDRKMEKGNGEPLYNGLNLLDLGDIRIPSETTVPSFSSYGLSYEHELQVELWGECADREFSGFACKEQVQIFPDWQLPSEATDDLPDSEPRPEYQVVDPLATVHEMDGTHRTHELPGSDMAYEMHSDVPIYELPSRTAPPPVVSRAVPPPPYVG